MRRMTALAALLASLALAGSAQAAPINIGSPLAADFQIAGVNKTSTQMNSTLTDPGALVSAPVSGALIRWRYVGGIGGPFFLRVLRPGAAGTYTTVASSPAVVPISTGEEVQEIAIPVQAGDTIGINLPAGAKIGARAVAGPAGVSSWIPPIVEGQTRAPDALQQGIELGFSALLLPAPTIASIDPPYASFQGGNKVTITGTDIGSATSVEFGGIPVAFTPQSESQIRATAPGGRLGPTSVTVTTVAGTSAPSSFTTIACVVPKLKGKTVKQARKRLKRTWCSLPVILHREGARAKSGRVQKQIPKPGKRRYSPSKRITLIVG